MAGRSTPTVETNAEVTRLNNSPLISIVDDNESVRTAMRDMVESFGFAVADFASGAEFLGSDSLHGSACLITDVRMSGMNGFELHEQLVASGHSIPTIFMTAFPDKRGSSRAIKAGAVAYLSKPCGRSDLLEHIHSALAPTTRGRPS
jgi:FixJ family two-component response regulator